MQKNYQSTVQIDQLDQQILRTLTQDARTPYAEMAKHFGVSPGTIHVRVEKMRQAGIIEGKIFAFILQKCEQDQK